MEKNLTCFHAICNCLHEKMAKWKFNCTIMLNFFKLQHDLYTFILHFILSHSSQLSIRKDSASPFRDVRKLFTQKIRKAPQK